MEPERNEPQNRKIEINAANPDEKFHIGCLPNEILCIIFQNLNEKDLSRAAMVCRKWLEIANHEKRFRPFCFAAYNIFTMGKTFASIAHSFIPSVGFFLLRPSLYNNNVDNNATGAICELFPPNCKTIILFTFVGSLNKNLCGYVTRVPYMVCALLPQHPNVQLSTVIVQDSIPKETYTEYTQMIETASRQNHESFMCLMLFCDLKYLGSNMARRMAEIAKSTFDHNKRVSLCGGMVNQLRTNNETGLSSLSYCVALLITGSIQTWSIVLEEETRWLAQEKLQIFKKQVKLRKRAVAFVFFSNSLSHNVQDWELTVFRELFPNVPLIGCGSALEFGRDTATYEAKFLGVQNKDWVKTHSVTFMILTYG